MRLKQIFLLTTISVVLLAACGKGKDPIPPDTGDKARADLTRDSIFLYAKQVYLWSDALPTAEVFNAKKYTTKSTDFLNYQDELIAISQYKVNPTTNLPYEYYLSNSVVDAKYSYISDVANQNPVAYIPNKQSSVDLEGNGNDFGIKLGAYDQTQPGSTVDEFALFATAIYQNSPADKAGMVRSHRIYKINDRTIGGSYKADRTFINNAFASTATTVKIEGVKYENGTAGAPYTLTLNKAVYQSSPVYAAKVFTAGAKKIGYLAYARFSRLSNSKPALDAAFTKFADANVKELIIDLRYNGGGYLGTAEYLINQIASSSLTGKVMYSEHYNALMQSGGASILKNQPLLDANGKIQYQGTKMLTYDDVDYSIAGNTELFSKSGPLNGVTKVVFIVSGNTASASELVINTLKPFITVEMIGTQTYGKPVGFFPMRLENKYDVFYSLFHIKNSLGQGDYFSGFKPDVVDDFDDPRNDFGDPLEYYTMLALNRFGINTPVTTAIAKTMSINGRNVAVTSLQPMKPIVSGNEFVGMIDTKHKIKK